MVYGDSNIQARFSHIQNTFPYKLQENLRKLTGKQIEVVNAGVIGFGPDQSLIRFSREADIYIPNIVIFHVFADNDFGDLIRNQLFTLDHQGNAVNASHMQEGSHTALWSLNEFRNILSYLLITRAAVKIWKKMTRLMGGSDGEYPVPKAESNMEEQLKKLISASDKDYAMYKKGIRTSRDHYDIDIAMFPEKESSKTKKVLMNHVLREAKTLANLRNIKFIVVIQPSSRDMTANLALNYNHFSQSSKYKRDNLASAVDNICVDNEIHKVNLFDLFQRNEPEKLYFTAGDDHWNDSGQELAAQEVARYIYAEHISTDIEGM